MFNRVAFITGASRGIGRATALSLCRAGFDIVMASPDIERNEEVAAEIRACSGEAMTVNLDVTSIDSVKAAFAKALKDKSRIDVLVNNAGIARDGLAVRMKQADWDLVLRLNLDGAFLCIQQVLPSMMRNRWGRIINHIGGWTGRQRRSGQLRGFQGRPHRTDQSAGTGDGQPKHHGERSGARLHCHRHDQCNAGRCEAEDPVLGSLGPHGQTRGHRCGREVPRQRGRRLYHGTGFGCQRRDVYVTPAVLPPVSRTGGKTAGDATRYPGPKYVTWT
jgi:hypothetical protein